LANTNPPDPDSDGDGILDGADPDHSIAFSDRLIVTRAGTGGGSVTSEPAGIACGNLCDFGFANGTVVTLSVTPEAGSRFAGWDGAGCSGTQACTLVLDQSHTVAATFSPILSNECAGSPVLVEATAFGAGASAVSSEVSIATSGDVRIHPGAIVTFRAPALALRPGFHVHRGAQLLVQTQAVTCVTTKAGGQSGAKLAPSPALLQRDTSAESRGGVVHYAQPGRLPSWVWMALEALAIHVDALGQVLLDEEGQWLVFETAQDLSATDTNGVGDVYRLDLAMESLVLVSRAPHGYAGNGPSGYPATDRFGEWVVFQSDADDLVGDDGNSVTDIFIHEVWTGETTRITSDSRRASAHPVLDGAGEELLYDQVGQDGHRQILADTVWASGLAQPIGLDQDEAGLALDNHHPAISTHGRFIAYLEERGTDQERACHVHLFDRDTGDYQRQACPEDLALEAEDTRPSFSADGRQVEWYLPATGSVAVIPNTLMEKGSGNAP